MNGSLVEMAVQYAIKDGFRQTASPGERAICPLCKTEVAAKCGEINIWHWAHVRNEDCDPWAASDGEGPWHKEWKERFPLEWREVVVGCHRADVKTPRCVVELQSSNIPEEEICDRERFYEKMVWVLDAKRFRKNFTLTFRSGYVSFRWKRPRKCWWASRRYIFLDFGSGRLLQIKKLYGDIPCGGWGVFIDYQSFVIEYSK